MRCWLVTIGEPVPLDGAEPRLLRTGRLAQVLAAAGHDVVWWNSTFDHARKRFVRPGPATVALTPRLELRLLHGRRYDGHVSIARLRNHREVAAQFRQEARMVADGGAHPDVILCSFPTIELSDEAVAFARERGIPIALDVRDRWPDIFVDVFPAPLRAFAWLGLAPYRAATRRAFRGADAVVGISDGFLEWGLRQAAREARALDAVHPMGYQHVADPDPGADLDARARLVAKGVDLARPLIWFVGTLGRMFDLGPVIEAAKRMQDAEASGTGAPLFVISGEGERSAHWRALGAGVRNVVFTGWIDRHEISVMLRAAALGLAPYAAEKSVGLPNKLFEYLSAGIPIVSSFRGETERLLDESGSGVTYESSDADALYALLVALMADPARREQMRDAARRLFEARFTAERVDAGLVAYLTQLAATARRRDFPQATAGGSR